MDERVQSLAHRVLRIAQQREEDDFTGFLLHSELPRELLAAFRSSSGEAEEGAYGLLAEALYQVASNETRRGIFKDGTDSLQELQMVLRQAVDALDDALMRESTKVHALAGVRKVMQRRFFSRAVEEGSASNWVHEQGSQALIRVNKTLQAAVEVNRPFRF